jgi:hypothetical protein
VNIKDERGISPLNTAAERGIPECVSFLLDHGADMEPSTKGYTPLMRFVLVLFVLIFGRAAGNGYHTSSYYLLKSIEGITEPPMLFNPKEKKKEEYRLFFIIFKFPDPKRTNQLHI